jgi:hypothetical protein
MSLGGRMLAINEGFGYRPLLTVKTVKFVHQFQDRPPCTIVYGDQLMFQQDNPALYMKFLSDKYGTVLPWDQLRIANEDTLEQVYALWPKFPVVVVLEENLKLIDAGKDLLAGYWVKFEGGPIKLFSQPEWWKESEDFEF